MYTLFTTYIPHLHIVIYLVTDTMQYLSYGYLNNNKNIYRCKWYYVNSVVTLSGTDVMFLILEKK